MEKHGKENEDEYIGRGKIEERGYLGEQEEGQGLDTENLNTSRTKHLLLRELFKRAKKNK